MSDLRSPFQPRARIFSGRHVHQLRFGPRTYLCLWCSPLVAHALAFGQDRNLGSPPLLTLRAHPDISFTRALDLPGSDLRSREPLGHSRESDRSSSKLVTQEYEGLRTPPPIYAAFRIGSSTGGSHRTRTLSRCRRMTRVTANKASDWQRGQRTAESPIASQSLQRWAFARLTKLDWCMTVHLARRASIRRRPCQKNPRLGQPGYS